jgi:hypothetical protein
MIWPRAIHIHPRCLPSSLSASSGWGMYGFDTDRRCPSKSPSGDHAGIVSRMLYVLLVLLSAAAPATAQTAPVEDRSTSPPFVAFYQRGRIFGMEPRNKLWISPMTRLQLDGIFFIGPGINDGGRELDGSYRRPDVRDTLLVRRAHLEVSAGAFDRFTAQVVGEFGTSSPVQNGDPPAGATPVLLVGWFNAKAHPLLQFMAGQMFTPFTMDNRTPPPLFDTPETAMMVRSLAVPASREVGFTLWGADTRRVFDYQAGLFVGDGIARINRDAAWDLIARASVRPLMWTGGKLADVHVGASFRYGTRGQSVDYAYPSQGTPGGYQFFKSVYGSGTGAMTIVPDGNQWYIAAELLVPVGRFDLRAEATYVSHGTREMVTTGGLSGDPLRRGILRGFGFYAQLAWWPWGDVRVNGWPGSGHRPPEPDPTNTVVPRLPRGLQVLARIEAVDFFYDADARGTQGEARSAREGQYTVWGLAGAVNYWFATHVRLTAHYEQYFMAAPPTSSATPANNMAYGPRNADGPQWTFGELTFRLALQI